MCNSSSDEYAESEDAESHEWTADDMEKNLKKLDKKPRKHLAKPFVKK